METPIIDLHCDLLSYLAEKKGRSPVDSIARCSYPQLIEGHVKLQTLAIYTATGPKSVKEGLKQVQHYRALVTQYPTSFAHVQLPLNTGAQIVSLIPAFENASSFASETEPLADALKRLEEYQQELGLIFYISFTWDEENRFGGGNRTQIGLKEDGKRLLEWMHGKKIAVDFSHTSDKLAYGILECIDKHAFDIPILASHSNFRAISNYPRNLPEELAREIIRRKGIIGLNLFAPFIHDTDPSALLRHVEYALSLGGEDALCFGADFFCDADAGSFLQQKYQRDEAYYPAYSDASCYPRILQLLSQQLLLKDQQLQKIASQNALYFLREKIV